MRKTITSSLLITGLIFGGSAVFDETIEYLAKNQRNPIESISGQLNQNPFAQFEALRLTPQANAFSIWSLLLPLAGGFLTQAMNPPKTDVFMATSPSISLRDPNGQYLPPVLPQARQQAVILRKRVKISEIKVGSNGNCLEKVEFFIDGRKSTKIRLECEPYSVGTDLIDRDERNKIFDTANPFWEPGKIYYIGFRAKGERDEDVDGEHPGYNTIPVIILDDTPFQMAASRTPQGEEYRACLANNLGSLPSIPVSTMVTADGRVIHSLAPNQDLATNQLQVSQPPGVVQPNQPVPAQRNDGLAVRSFLRGHNVKGTVVLRQSDRLYFENGSLATRNMVVVLKDTGEEIFRKEYRRSDWPSLRPSLNFDQLAPGTYRILVQALGADNSVGESLRLTVQVKK